MKSKKRSATNRESPEPITFFIDRSLGRLAGQMLRETGAKVILHDEQFAEDAADVEWLTEVGSQHWVVITKDKRIRYRPLERDAVLAANLRVFVLAASKGLTGTQMAACSLSTERVSSDWRESARRLSSLGSTKMLSASMIYLNKNRRTTPAGSCLR